MPEDVVTTPQGDALKGLLLEALLQNTSLAMAVGDADGTVTLMSPGLQELIDTPFAPVPSEAIARHFKVLTEDGRRLLHPTEEPLNRARSGETFSGQVMRVDLTSGAHVYLRARGAPLVGSDGTVLGGFVVFDDVTSERALEHQRRALRDRLVETVNHELRTPLTALLGHAELLEELGPQLPEWANRSLASVLDAGERLRDLVHTVSALVDLEEAGNVVRADTDVVAVVLRCVETGIRAWPDVEAVVDAPGALTASVDPRLLARAVNALLGNALQYGPLVQQVDVSVQDEGAWVRIAVADQGPGIDEVERQRLVQPFERGVSGLTAPPGRGLGLAVARSVAEAHGGSLELEGNSPTGLRAVLCVPR